MFVDDNSDNAFGVYMTFAHPEFQRLEQLGEEARYGELPAPTPTVECIGVAEHGVVMHSCWLPPPPSGKVRPCPSAHLFVRSNVSLRLPTPPP